MAHQAIIMEEAVVVGVLLPLLNGYFVSQKNLRLRLFLNQLRLVPVVLPDLSGALFRINVFQVAPSDNIIVHQKVSVNQQDNHVLL